MVRLLSSLTSLAAAAAALLTASTSVTGATGFVFKGTPPLVVKGYRFFDSATGAYFGARGVNYYPRPNAGPLDANNLDLFTSKFEHLRRRDFPQFEALSANAIRLYAVDPDADHSAFMCELQALGIYVIVDLGSSCQGCEITPVAPPACYPKSYKERGEKIIRDFARYDNVMAFSGGNEVNHRSAAKGKHSNAPCQKMFVRDMRNFIAAHKSVGMRQVPVGLVTADADRDENALYYNCESSSLSYERAEWYGLNTYIQCDDIADPKKATGFNNLRDSFAGYKYSIPVLLTEFGCTSERFPTVREYTGQRTFHDALWMNSRDYTEYFAGGFVFEYSTENANSKSTSAFPFKKFGPQNYGLGYLEPENCDEVTVKCNYVPMPNFESLAAAYKATDTSSEPTLSTFTPAPDRTAPTACPVGYPSIGDFTWEGGVNPLQMYSASAVARFQCPTTEAGFQALLAARLSPEAGVVTTYSPMMEAAPSAMIGSNNTGMGNSTAAIAPKKNATKATTAGSAPDDSDDDSKRATPVPTKKETKAPANDAASAIALDPAETESSSGSDDGAPETETRVRATSAAGAPAKSAAGTLVALFAVALALLQHV